MSQPQSGDEFADLFDEIGRWEKYDRQDVIKSIPRVVQDAWAIEYKDYRYERRELSLFYKKAFRKVKWSRSRKTFILEIVRQVETYKSLQSLFSRYTEDLTGEEKDFLAGLRNNYPQLSEQFLELLELNEDFPIDRLISWRPCRQEPLDEMGFLYVFSIYETPEQFKQILDTGIPISYVYKLALEEK